MVRLEAFLDGWKTARQDAAQAVEDLPAGKLDFKPQDDLMTFREIAEHIIHVGRSLTGMMLDGEDDLAAPDFFEKLKSYFQPLPDNADASTIAAEMRKAVEEHCTQLSRRPPEFFAQMITKFDGLKITRLEMMQFVKEHELTHRSQIFMYLRMNGVVPPTTRRRLAKKQH